MSEHLRIYMNDQLAAGIVWRELAWRAQRHNRGTPLGEALARVAQITAEDVESFIGMMDRLGLARNPVKIGGAIVSERLSRLKVNGRFGSRSSLSRFTELDFLLLGVVGKKLLWENLRGLADLRTRLPDVDFDELLKRAQTQIDLLRPFHADAGRHALTT
jgi:hypothetical protein